jgi:tRNA threonylcarbamoyladenosine biosynthesis protein TsaB
VRILALDTATESCSAALLIEGHVIGREAELARGHAERILPMIDELLAEAGAALSSLDAIAFGRGPGSFTGVRLAASITQGLAFGAGLGVVPISDLRAVAQRAFDLNGVVTRALVCNDARMHEVYWGCFERDPGGLAVGVGVEHVGKPGSVVLPAGWLTDEAARAAHGQVRVHGAGRGFAAYPELRSVLPGPPGGYSDRLLPRASEIAALAAPEVRSGRLLSADAAIPVYLRDDVAQAAAPKSLN